MPTDLSTDLLVTGFTAFGKFTANPAESIARKVAHALGARFHPLEVSYAAVSDFIDSLQASPPTRWVMIGVAGNADKLRVEWRAKNRVGTTPDTRGHAPTGPISADHPPHIDTNYFSAPPPLPPDCILSHDAGDYLCNYIYHTARTRLPATRAIFFHITPTDKLAEQTQVDAILKLLG